MTEVHEQPSILLRTVRDALAPVARLHRVIGDFASYPFWQRYGNRRRSLRSRLVGILDQSECAAIIGRLRHLQRRMDLHRGIERYPAKAN